MKIIELIRLMLKHLVLLIVVPITLAGLVIMLTKEPKLTYSSKTILYTGLATGSSIEMDKAFNYFATNTAFDNLINIIKSRETQEEVAIRLLSQHLLLPKADPKYISAKLYTELKKKIPGYIYAYVANGSTTTPLVDTGTKKNSNPDSLSDKVATDSAILFPAAINRSDYEKTVENLTALMKSSDTNFVYKLLNYNDEHYSIKAISTVKAERINSSDLIKLSYEVGDPGICQQTLAIFNEVCIKNYKRIKENRSDAVVKYFETQLGLANVQLKNAEDKLLGFNKANNIINYYEQSKAVAVVKEDMEVDYNNKKAQLAGTEAATKRLEEKLNIQQQVQLKSNSILEKRKQLGDVNFEIASAESESVNATDNSKVQALKKQSETLKSDIKKSVDELYSYQNTTDGLPVATVLSEWINNVVESENLRAKLKVMDQRNRDFQQQYSIYAPAGAHIKRIEREISVSEQGYLEILHGLNLAKLKLQDNELSANLKAVDPPFYPLESIPTKRAVLVIAAALVGAILVLGIIITMEYLDDTLKNSKRASKILKLPAAGMIPKILQNPGKINLPFIQNRLIEITAQNTEQFLSTHNSGTAVKTVLLLSTMEMEGKSVVGSNLAKKLKAEGKKILLLNYSKKQQAVKQQQRKFPLMNRLLGYQDPRIDFNNTFLADASCYLQPSEYFTYNIDEQFYKSKNYTDILEQNNFTLSFVPDYVFIELPALIYNNYPADLVSAADMSLLICRSNRLWSEADQSALNTLLPLSGTRMNCIVNGVELKEVESVLGDLPKKSSRLRKKIKNLFRFQFFSKNQI